SGACRMRWRVGLSMIGLLALSGCLSVGPDYVPPEPTDFSETDFVYGASYDTSVPLSDWWTAFNDPILTGLIDQGLSENRSLEVASANLAAARANFGLSRQNRLPFDSITVTAQETRFAAAASPFAGSERLPNVSLVSFGTSAAWELDVFGRVSRLIEIASAQTDAALADLVDLQAIIATDIADAYLDLRGAQFQLDVAERNAAVQSESLDLTIVIRDAGRGTDLDVEQARAQLETTRASIPPLRARAVAAANQLAVLTGQTPAAVTGLVEARGALPEITEALRIGDPAALLRRRPDIAASERLLAATFNTIGLELAEAFPRIDLVGGASVEADGFDALNLPQALAFNIGPSISWSITDLLRARNRIDAAEAETNAAFAAYEQTILLALSEIETALNTQAELQEQIVHLRAAEEASAEAAKLSRIRFENGRTDFLQVLDAQGRALVASDQRVAIETEIARAQVAVFRALRAGPVALETERSSDAG
ncbi:MAG: efflux transporter outer membrane subunit, partial [Pseudomonadota bacterium]